MGLRAGSVLVATRIVKLESLAQAGALASRVLALALRGALLPPAMFCSATVPAPASVLAGPGLPLGPALATRGACPAGRYAAAGAAGCTSCAAGQYQPSVGADRCEPCGEPIRGRQRGGGLRGGRPGRVGDARGPGPDRGLGRRQPRHATEVPRPDCG